MKVLKAAFVSIGCLAILLSITGNVHAGGGTTGALASCESAKANGSSIYVDGAADVDPSSGNGDVMIHIKYGGVDNYFRAWVSNINLGTSNQEAICTMLNNQQVTGGPSLATQIVGALAFNVPRILCISKGSLPTTGDIFGTVPPGAPSHPNQMGIINVTLYAEQASSCH